VGFGFQSFRDRVGHAQWVVELLASWRGQSGSHSIIEVWRMVPLCLMSMMWSIWRERNAQNFKDREKMVVELKAILFKTL
jgi:hypothetical protein